MSLRIRWAALFVLVGALFSMPATATAEETVTVTLDVGFTLSVNQPSVATGAVIFDTTNIDTLFVHNLRVVKTDLAPGNLPLSGSVVDEAQVNIVTRTGDLAAAGGSESTPSVDLAAGNYELICNIAGHYASGMYTAFQVTGPAAPTDTPAPSDTPAASGPAPVPTATPGSAAVPTSLPPTGTEAPVDSSSGGWWVLALLGAAGFGLSGLALAAHRRSG